MPVGGAYAWGPAVAAAITGGAGVATAVYAGRTGSRANRQANKYQSYADSRAERMETDNETRRREEFDRSERMAEQAWNAEQARLDRDEARDDERYQTELLESQRRFGVDTAARVRDENMDRTRWNANAPYRATGTAALAELAQLAGLSVTPGAEVPMVPGETAEPLPPPAPRPQPAPPPIASIPPDRIGPVGGPGNPPRREIPSSASGRQSMPTPDRDGLVEFRMSREAYATLAGEQQRREDEMAQPPMSPASLMPQRRNRTPLRSLTQYPRMA